MPVAFNASASSDPDGSIARYDWGFGDGQTAADGGPSPSHTYAAPGTYQATLTLTDNEGCSTALVFTGQTASCNGASTASQTQTVKVAYPGVRVKCPKSARPRLQVQAAGRHQEAQGQGRERRRRAKVKAGKSAIVSLKPKTEFSGQARRRQEDPGQETLTINGSKRTRFPKLKIVQ